MELWPVLAVSVPAVIALVLAWALLRLRARTERDLAAARAETAELRDSLAQIERRLAEAPAPVAHDEREYVITRLGDQSDDALPAGVTTGERIDGRLFADLVARESAVKAAGLVHGLRRALAPETRNRIRFEMGREVKRARRQRRAEIKQARRDLHAQQRRIA
ncbi:hypothetical protein [Nocardioides pacificus]